MNAALILSAAHFMALGQIESGDNDMAVGKWGEVSRYQILPSVWEHYASKTFTHPIPSNQEQAKNVAFAIWTDRIEWFERTHHAEPNNVELYLLWHRPANVHSPMPKDLDLAQRFANLVDRFQHEHRT